MDQQGVFEFCRNEPARPDKPERLFFAVLPETQTMLRIVRFMEGFAAGLKGSRVAADRLHLSLHHVGDFKRLRSATLLAAKRAGDAVSRRSFEMTLHSVGSFGAKKRDGHVLALVGEGAGLSELHHLLGAAMKKNGLGADNPFAPHMALLYGAPPLAMQLIEPISLMVKDFALIHSARGLKKYTVLQRWTLAPQ